MTFLWAKLDEIDLDDIWFQQNGATCLTASVTINSLQQKFGKSIISKNATVNWSSRSYDLTPLELRRVIEEDEINEQ